MGYKVVYDSWKVDLEVFWMEQVNVIDWIILLIKVLFDDNVFLYEWFLDVLVNICYNVVDCYVIVGNGDWIVIIYDSFVIDIKLMIIYVDFFDKVVSLVGVLVFKGVIKGDCVVIYMLMVFEVLIVMLVCVCIGVIYLVVFGGFVVNELVVCIDDV